MGGRNDRRRPDRGGGHGDDHGRGYGDDQYGSHQQGRENPPRGGGHQQGRGPRGDHQRTPQGGGPGRQGGGGYGYQPRFNTDVLGKRIGAFLIDAVILFFVFYLLLALGIGLSVGLAGVSNSGAGGVVGILLILVGFGGLVFYLFFLEGYWNGQTLGKKALSIRVVTEDGGQIGYAESLIRNVVELVEGTFYYVPAIIIIASSDRDQRLGDIAANTLVIDDSSPHPPRGYQQPPPGSPPQQPPRDPQQRPPQGRGPQHQSPQHGQAQHERDQYRQTQHSETSTTRSRRQHPQPSRRQ